MLIEAQRLRSITADHVHPVFAGARRTICECNLHIFRICVLVIVDAKAFMQNMRLHIRINLNLLIGKSAAERRDQMSAILYIII